MGGTTPADVSFADDIQNALLKRSVHTVVQGIMLLYQKESSLLLIRVVESWK